jgi:hypothetical protein
MSIGEVCNWINYACKGLSVGGAVVETVQTLQDEELSSTHKAARTATNGLYVVAQTAELAVNVHVDTLDPASEAAKEGAKMLLATKVAAGATDITRVVTSRGLRPEPWTSDDTYDVLGTLTFRIADIGGYAAANCLDICHGHHELVEQVANVVCASSRLIVSRRTIQTALTLIGEHLPSIGDSEEELETFDIVNGVNIDAEYLQDFRDIIAAKSIAALKRIPSLFRADVVFNMFKCAVSDLPIRSIVAVKGTEESDSPVFLEKDTIEVLLHAIPRKVPNGWPKKIRFCRVNVIPCRSEQRVINQRLELMLPDAQSEIRRMREEFRSRSV